MASRADAWSPDHASLAVLMTAAALPVSSERIAPDLIKDCTWRYNGAVLRSRHERGVTMPPPSNRDDGVRPYLGVGFGVIIVSTAAILIRLAQATQRNSSLDCFQIKLA